MGRLRIVKYPWHTGHDYELVKLPHDFLFLNSTVRKWARHHRPVPERIKWISSLTACDSDLMILHLDQWSYQEPSKRFLFEHFRDSYPGHKVVILHGACTSDGMTQDQLKNLVRGSTVVCNSEAALQSWNLSNARYIKHGMSPEEWPGSDHSLGNILVVQAFQSRHREVRNLQGVKTAERKVPITWIGRDIHPSSFDEYRNILSRSSIFFNPSYSSANPRSRTEAMLCGLAIVTTCSNGEESFIENGVNGFCSNDLEELIDALERLRRDRALAKKVGERGRETARQYFHIDHFREQWEILLSDLYRREAA